jgi:hypothetical protein
VNVGYRVLQDSQRITFDRPALGFHVAELQTYNRPD